MASCVRQGTHAPRHSCVFCGVCGLGVGVGIGKRVRACVWLLGVYRHVRVCICTCARTACTVSAQGGRHGPRRQHPMQQDYPQLTLRARNQSQRRAGRGLTSCCMKAICWWAEACCKQGKGRERPGDVCAGVMAGGPHKRCGGRRQAHAPVVATLQEAAPRCQAGHQAECRHARNASKVQAPVTGAALEGQQRGAWPFNTVALRPA